MLSLFRYVVWWLLLGIQSSGLYKKVYLLSSLILAYHTPALKCIYVNLCMKFSFFLLFLSMPLDLESSHWLSSAAVTEVNFNLALTLVSNIFAKSILFLAQLFQKKFRNWLFTKHFNFFHLIIFDQDDKWHQSMFKIQSQLYSFCILHSGRNP